MKLIVLPSNSNMNLQQSSSLCIPCRSLCWCHGCALKLALLNNFLNINLATGYTTKMVTLLSVTAVPVPFPAESISVKKVKVVCSYGVSLAIWDHTALPFTRHKWTHPALTPARQASTQFTYPRGMAGWVDLGDWLHSEMIYPPTDGHPSKY